jgi:hypothetical protein
MVFIQSSHKWSIVLLWCGFYYLQNFPLPTQQVEGDRAVDVPAKVDSELSSVRAVVPQDASATPVGVGAGAECEVAVVG